MAEPSADEVVAILQRVFAGDLQAYAELWDAPWLERLGSMDLPEFSFTREAVGSVLEQMRVERPLRQFLESWSLFIRDGIIRGYDTGIEARMDELTLEFAARLDMIDIDGPLLTEEIDEWEERLAAEPVVWPD
jgi:hypothetical protein